MFKRIIFIILNTVLIAGCSDDSSSYVSSEGKSLPYILKENCKFTIVGELGKSSATSPKATGVEDSAVSLSISFNDMSITVSDCKIVGNSHSLPIYED